MNIVTESQEKEKRLRQALDELEVDSVIITRRSNYAWLTCGGEAVSSRVSPTSPVYLVHTPQRKYAVGYTMDLPWVLEQTLSDLHYEGVLLSPFSTTPEQKALDLAAGRPAADDSFLGIDDINTRIVKLHEPYTVEEMARYRQLASECAAIQSELANWIERGMTERQVLARMWQLSLERGMEGHYMFVGSDERIRRFRHPVPSDKAIDKAVLLAPAVAKWGLLASTSRLIYFEKPPADIRHRFQAAATIQAALLARTRIGTPLTSLFQLIMDLYVQLGYSEERYNHFHGGPVGYWAGYAERMQDPEEFVKTNMAFLYYLTAAGVHCEELMLVDDAKVEYVSISENWPMLNITFDDTTIAVPDILVKS